MSHLAKHEELLYRAASREASFERRPPKITSWKPDEDADATNASQKNASLYNRYLSSIEQKMFGLHTVNVRVKPPEKENKAEMRSS